MPIRVSYPGVYVQEIPGGQPVTAGVSTASTAFIDFFSRGPMEKAKQVFSMAEVNRSFGGLHLRSEASYGLKQYFLNGGQEAWIVRATDGTAIKALLDVKVNTPGLDVRFQWATDSADAADKAQQAAKRAAEKAKDALTALAAAVNDQQRTQGGGDLRSATTESADETYKATAATRAAAEQAKASSDELAIAIAALAAASGPVADRTAQAAEHTAQAAAASSDAAKTTPAVIAAAQKAVEVAKKGLSAGQSSRTAQTAAKTLADLQTAVDAAKAAIATVTAEETAVTDAGDNLVASKGAAYNAAVAAEDAVAQADTAAREALSVAKTVYEHHKAAGNDDDAKAAKEDVDAASDSEQITTLATAANAAAEAQLDSQTIMETADATAAATKAKGAADQAKSVIDKVETIAAKGLTSVLTMASEAADTSATLAVKEGDGTVGEAVKAANKEILKANAAAKAALVACKLTSDDAKVAASCVGSAKVNLDARGAIAGAEKAAADTIETLKAAKVITAQLNKALILALDSTKPAVESAAAATAAGGNADLSINEKIKAAAAAAQAALNAANNCVAAAEAVEKAATEVSRVALQATTAADLAARAAKVAVAANKEASQPPTLRIAAANEGIWGDNIQVEIKVDGANFSLVVTEYLTERGVTRQVGQENYSSLNLEKGENTYAIPVVNDQSDLVSLDYIGLMVSGAYPADIDGEFLNGGDDGGHADATQLTGADGAMSALEDIQPYIFNLLSLPSVANMPAAEASVATANAQVYCGEKRAFYIVDIPEIVDDTDKMLEWVNSYGNAQAYYMAVYYPRLVIPDPLQDFRERNVGPSGTLAGIYSRTDTARGVWKAPAGINAVLQGAQVSSKVTDIQNGLLNPRGVNVLRTFPIYGNISWGARTLAGADALSSEWKYISVRRLVNYIEESLFQSLKWAVFEPNNDVLWAKIRSQIATFLSSLFSQGAFQGAGEGSAYFVTCDGTTTTPVDIELGMVNIDVGVAPVKPAEFVVLRMQQIAQAAA